MFKNLHPSLRRAMYLVLFSFVALVSATVYTIRLTYKHYEPVMDKNYYEVGLNYEKAIASQKLLLSEGYILKSNWEKDSIFPKGKRPIAVEVTKLGKVSKADSITLFLERNATTKHTLRYELKKQGDQFVGEIPIKETGNWNTRIVADLSGRSFEKDGQIAVR